MRQLEQIMVAHPTYGFSSHYALAGNDWRSIVSFFNYYEQVFPGLGVEAHLYVVFHDPDGRELHAHDQVVAPGAAVQVNTRELGITKPGLVAVAAIAKADLTALAAGRFKVNPKVPTGFYMTWDKAGKYRDFMHEWEGVANGPASTVTHHIGLNFTALLDDYGLVVMNPNLAAPPPGRDRMSVRNATDNKILGEVELERLPAMGSRVIKFADHFPAINEWLKLNRILLVDFVTTQQAGPLTFEWHKAGDFHIHHL
jgi:hypothetical protein